MDFYSEDDGDEHEFPETEPDDCSDGSWDDTGAAEDEGYTSSDDSIDIDDPTTSPRQQHKYTTMSEADIRRRQEEEVNEVSNTLLISRASSCILLRRYNWDVARVEETWFTDEEAVRKAVGLPEEPVETTPDSGDITCGICFDTYPSDTMTAAACGHRYCAACWQVYIGTSITDGPGCLMLRCPDPSCDAAVGQDMVDLLATEGGREKYSRYLMRSYIEDGRGKRWCPSPGCEFAVDFMACSENQDITCNCSYIFCCGCGEEAHRPVDCETVAKWMLKNSSEGENTSWILANSKSCPKCKRPIEKNHGCMHMKCRAPCEFQFCWLCLGDWNDHGENTGGYYKCNSYQEENDSERIRDMAENSLDRYTHYYERWVNNHQSRQTAIEFLQGLQDGKLDELRERQGLLRVELEFITEAWLQIVECRRVLKWTYAYGYYVPEEEVTRGQFFEHLQGEAECGLERLHHCAEEELQGFRNADADDPRREGFLELRQKLAGLTRVTRSYFESLAGAIERAAVCLHDSPEEEIPRAKVVKVRKARGPRTSSRARRAEKKIRQ